MCILVRTASFPRFWSYAGTGWKKSCLIWTGCLFSLRWSKIKKKNSWKKKFKIIDSKKPHFPAPSILNIFSWNFYGLVLGLLELIDAKGIGVSQLIWSWGCPTLAQKRPKNTKNTFFACFWANVRQPHDHISWAIPMPFASTNCTNPRTSPWKFHENILRIGRAGKRVFFWVGHFDFFLLYLSGKTSPFIWGIIYFCTMDVFFRILGKKLSELLCTRL